MAKFKRPPTRKVNTKQKETLMNNFIDGAARATRNTKKEKKEVIFLRIPLSLYEDLDFICSMTGYKKNAFCIQAIIEATRIKLRTLRG